MNIYDFLITKNKDNKLIGKEKCTIVEKFIYQFVDEQLITQNILYWNSIKCEYRPIMKIITLEKINTMNISNLENLYIYLERHKELFKGSMKSITDFINQQEPWEETDITVFDESYNWFISFTHEDEILYIEL